MESTPWFKRKFSTIEDNGLLPSIVERLDGTPVRLRNKLTGINNEEVLERKSQNKWSIKEETGHLADLEPLWSGRIDEIISGKEVMMAADLTNATTHNADHNSTSLEMLLDQFGHLRNTLIQKLKDLVVKDLEKSSRHPRLDTPMRIIDLCYFVAEHDDHHLARISKMLDLESSLGGKSKGRIRSV